MGLVLLANILFALNVIAMKVVVDASAPLLSVALRMGVVFLICAPALRVLPGRTGWLMLYGFLNGGLFLLLLVPVAIVAMLQRGHHRYGLIGRTFHVQRGVLGQKRWIVPARNIQAITVRRSWLQRRLGTASVYSDTAGASIIATPSVEDVRPGEAWALVDAIRPLRRVR